MQPDQGGKCKRRSGRFSGRIAPDDWANRSRWTSNPISGLLVEVEKGRPLNEKNQARSLSVYALIWGGPRPPLSGPGRPHRLGGVEVSFGGGDGFDPGLDLRIAGSGPGIFLQEGE